LGHFEPWGELGQQRHLVPGSKMRLEPLPKGTSRAKAQAVALVNQQDADRQRLIRPEKRGPLSNMAQHARVLVELSPTIDKSPWLPLHQPEQLRQELGHTRRSR
jgi:hypothetical protein